LEEVKRSEGASFILFGPIYATPSKLSYGAPVGLQALEKVASFSKVPVFAIGGITPARVKDCLQAGAQGVAVISAVLSAPKISEAVKAFEKELGTL
jgi:thiamine-phosphate pyrophosphorylase